MNEVRRYTTNSGKDVIGDWKTVVLLLCGADKRTQSTDTKRAIEYLKDYKKRNTKS